ncbi:hypothetical protein H839_16418 [Parageobacillus genomosp. 1]|uniref:Uncharacterized protein n=1 Tax=Parageobacillus genomosp. 1 TaxID=1295642 RepID=A0ABC9VAC1_9BACL|nr:hypothetical protein H839_16418 [Parageobacillus genomosp. 1]
MTKISFKTSYKKVLKNGIKVHNLLQYDYQQVVYFFLIGVPGTCRAMGTFNALTGFAALLASVMADLLRQSFGPVITFGVSGSLAVLAALFMVIFRI